MTIGQFQLLWALFLALVAVPVAAEGQQATKVYRVAIVFSTSPTSELTGPEPAHPLAKAFVHGMRALGYVEGQNIVLERLSAEGKFERFPEIFRGLVTNNIDAICHEPVDSGRQGRDADGAHRHDHQHESGSSGASAEPRTPRRKRHWSHP